MTDHERQQVRLDAKAEAAWEILRDLREELGGPTWQRRKPLEIVRRHAEVNERLADGHWGA